jgi:hypothetical protein
VSRTPYPSELRGKRGIWLLTLEYAGRQIRLSTKPVNINTADGSETYRFDGQLSAELGQERSLALFETEAGARSASVVGVVLPVDVALLESRGYAFSAASAEIAWHTPGNDWEEREVYLSGRVSRPRWSVDGEPVSFGVTEAPFTDRALIPESTAIVEPRTWPTAKEGAYGETYPEVFGAPGYYIDEGGTAQEAPGSPALVVEVTGDNADTLLIAGHRVNTGTVKIFDSDGAEESFGVAEARDGRGRFVATVDVSAAVTISRTSPQYWVCWSSGGGRLRPDEGAALERAGDVLSYYLGRSTLRVDGGRVAEAADLLSDYKLAGYIDRPTSPWELLRRYVLPLLPVSMTTGPRGVYPVVWRYAATVADAAFHLDADTGGLSRESEIEAERDWLDVVNEIRVSWAYDASERKPKRVTTFTAEREAGEYTSQQLYHSRREYGVSAREIEAMFVYDGPTAARIADARAREASAIPLRVSYSGGLEWAWLQPGMVGTLTDSDVHLSERTVMVRSERRSEAAVLLTLVILPDPQRDRNASAV